MVSGRACRATTRLERNSRRRFSSPTGAPPPVAITRCSPVHACATAARSMARKCVSPSSAKMRSMGLPASATIRSSVSTGCQPNCRANNEQTRDLPVQLKPMSTTRCTSAGREVSSNSQRRPTRPTRARPSPAGHAPASTRPAPAARSIARTRPRLDKLASVGRPACGTLAPASARSSGVSAGLYTRS